VGRLNWYKRDMRKALTGMMGLSLEERGAYNTVLDLIYDSDDKLPDDERFIAGWCGVDVRVWKRIRTSLIEKKKLRAESGLLRNFRATSEVDAALSLLDVKVTSGRKGGARPKKNKHLGQANGKQKATQPQPQPPSDVSMGSSGAGEIDMGRLKAALLEAAGWQSIASDKRLQNLSPIIGVIGSGADIQQDVLPAVREFASQCNTPNWKFFVHTIAQRRDDRLHAGTVKGSANVRRTASGRRSPRTKSNTQLLDEIDREDGTHDG